MLAIFKKPTPKLTLSPSIKIPGSIRNLRRTYSNLHDQGYIDKDAIILVRANEKLATDNKLLRKKNMGLRGAIFKKKRKRKREKALNFYNKGKQEGQVLFFNPTKITRVRERVAAQKNAELQQ